MGTEIDRLEILVQAEASKANAELEKLVGKLNNVSSALGSINTSGLKNLSSGVKQLSQSMQTMSGVKTADFTRLTKNIEKIGLIDQSSLYKVGNAIRNFTGTMNGIGSVSDDAVKLGTVANGISKLGGASVQKAITTLPQLSIALKEFMTTMSTAPAVSENLISMTNAMASLASNGSKFGSTINGMSRASQTLSRHLGGAATSTGVFAKAQRNAINPVASLTAGINKLVGAYFTLKYVVGGIASSIKKSMDFTETINLFQTSYKKIGEEAAQDLGMTWGSKSADAYAKGFISEAQNFNTNLTNALGLDPNTMMNYQATFAQISNSLGLTTNTVKDVSQSFTMLGNDIASLWNIDTKSAMEKLQSGLVGQTRPLRELGIDTTQASLQLTAYKYGIETSVTKMSQAEKVQLRWLTIMNQSSVAFGDMAKTINSPANQLRILKQQWENLSRSIGSVFIPAVMHVLPYINGVVIALREMIDTLAAAMGYKLPDYTDSNIYKDVTGDIIDTTDATDDATAANEKYKRSVMSIDELNILSKPTSSSSGSGSADTGSGNSKLDDAIKDKTDSYMKKFNEQLQGMSDKSKEVAAKIKEVLEPLQPFFEGLAIVFGSAWDTIKDFTGTVVYQWLKDIGKWMEKHPDTLKALGKGLGYVAIGLAGFKLINWLADITGISTLIGWLGRLHSKTKSVTKGFGEKNTALGNQVEAEEKDTAAVGTLALAMATAAAAALGLSGNLGGIKMPDLEPELAFSSSKVPALDLTAYNASVAEYQTAVSAPAIEGATAPSLGLDGYLTSESTYTAAVPAPVIEGATSPAIETSGFMASLQSMRTAISEFTTRTEASFAEWKINLGTDFKTAFDSLKTNASTATQSAKSSIASFISKTESSISSWGTAIETTFGTTFDSLKTDTSTCMSALKTAFSGFVTSTNTKMSTWKTNQETNFKAVLDYFKDNADEILPEVKADFKTFFTKTLTYEVTWGTNFSSNYKTVMDYISSTTAKSLTVAGNNILTFLRTTSSAVANWGMNTSTNFGETAQSWYSSIASSLSAAWDSFKSFMSATGKKISTWFDANKSWVVPVGITLAAVGAVAAIALTGGAAAPALAPLLAFESGGFPTPGQLFVANEPGNPELIGNIGGQTAVANNSQITAGIEEAAYRGYMRAIAESSGGNNGNVTIENKMYLEDDVVYHSYNRAKASNDGRFHPVTQGG